MRNKTLIIVRGASGSAKSTLARELAPEANFAADDYFEDEEGNYNFNPAEIGAAHQQCQARTVEAMERGEDRIAVHNTFSKAWEAAFYFEAAEEHGYNVFVVECQNDFGNVHGVPESVIQRMHERWEPLNRERLPLSTIARIRFWDWYYATKRRIRAALPWT